MQYNKKDVYPFLSTRKESFYEIFCEKSRLLCYGGSYAAVYADGLHFR